MIRSASGGNLSPDDILSLLKLRMSEVLKSNELRTEHFSIYGYDEPGIVLNQMTLNIPSDLHDVLHMAFDNCTLEELPDTVPKDPQILLFTYGYLLGRLIQEITVANMLSDKDSGFDLDPFNLVRVDDDK